MNKDNKDNKFNILACKKGTQQESQKYSISDSVNYMLKRITEKRKVELEYQHYMARYELEDLLGGPKRFVDDDGFIKEWNEDFSSIRVIREASKKENDLQNEVDELFDQVLSVERDLRRM